MKYKFNQNNTIALFNDLNQWDLRLTWFWCSIFAPAINLKYNTGIKLMIEDIIEIWNRQIKRGLLSKKGGKWEDWVNAVLEYVIENAENRGWEIPNLAVFKIWNKDEISDWIDRGYMVMVWIKVNKTFVKDIKDGIVDLFDDYINYKWEDLAHFTNLTRWKCRFDKNPCWDYNKEQFIDSYAFNKKWNPWTYKCNIKEVLEDIAMPTKYCFF